MPGLSKKVFIIAGVEGLILHLPNRRNERSIQITYTTIEISPLPYFKVVDSLSSTEFYGIIGMQHPMQVEKLFPNLSMIQECSPFLRSLI